MIFWMVVHGSKEQENVKNVINFIIKIPRKILVGFRVEQLKLQAFQRQQLVRAIMFLQYIIRVTYAVSISSLKT
jgi:hypothetical protein